MEGKKTFDRSLTDITSSLRSFIELSLHQDDKTWGEWISSVSREVKVRCWQEKNCEKTECPAYKSECGRCWLLAGSIRLTQDGRSCEEIPGGKSCCDCEIYKANVCVDSLTEIQEQIITLVHSLRSRQIELKELATQDSLTGLKNRHFFEMYIYHEVEKIKRGDDSMSVIMIDVNDFKYINDAFGHIAGDLVLKECAMILDKSIRASDVLFRFGGDEFLIVMSKAGEEETNILIQRVYENLATWNREQSEIDHKISLSIGFALLDKQHELLDVLEEADRQMYKDKKRCKVSAV